MATNTTPETLTLTEALDLLDANDQPEGATGLTFDPPGAGRLWTDSLETVRTYRAAGYDQEPGADTERCYSWDFSGADSLQDDLLGQLIEGES